MTPLSSSDQPPTNSPTTETATNRLRAQLWRIIFLTDTRAGRAFDVGLLSIIGVSILIVMLASVDSLRDQHARAFLVAEWFFTIVFTIEYAVRLWVVRRPSRYAWSFFGLVDLISFLPSYVELVISGSHYFMILRVLRMLRMFRVLKLAQHMGEAKSLINALRASRAKISVFLFAVMTLVCIEGTIMYLLEGEDNPGFHNIPQAIYWAIVTITTVGYGDAAPITVPGKMMAAAIMLTGFAIIAVPTGMVSAELGREITRSRRRRHRHQRGQRCRACDWDEHDPRARFCQQCGTPLPDE